MGVVDVQPLATVSPGQSIQLRAGTGVVPNPSTPGVSTDCDNAALEQVQARMNTPSATGADIATAKVPS